MLGLSQNVQYLLVGVAMGTLLLNPHNARAIAPQDRLTTLNPVAGSTQGIELPAAHVGVRDFVKTLRSQTSAYLRIDPTTGAVASVIGDLSPASRETAENVAVQFLAHQLGLPTGGATAKVGSAVHTLVLNRTLVSKHAHHVEFIHQVNGIPVDSEEVRVHVNDAGRVVALTGTYHPAPISESTGKVDAAAAVGIATSSLKIASLRAPATTRTVYVPVNGQLVLAHVVMMPAAEPLGDFEVMVATDGKILGGENLLCSATGEGKIYIHSPLSGDPQTVTLKDLDSSKSLTGSYVQVLNAKGAGASSSDRKYNYGPDDTHFDEVMMYYHINRVHEFFNFLNYHDRDSKPIKATVHYGTAYDNAFYSPMTDALSFGDGNKLNDLSKEDNVAYHEYTHAVSKTIVALRGEEGGGMNEGYSDYFAGSMNNDSKIGVWAVKKMNRPFMRNMDNKKHYPEDIGHEVHRDGEIWGAVCWDVRTSLGQNLADPIIHKSRYHLGTKTNFVGGLEGCIAADKELNNGDNAAKITAIFNARGIKSAAEAMGQQLRFLNSLINFGQTQGAE